MNNGASSRVQVDLIRAITVLTVLVTVIASFVLATEIILILFLGVLFGVFLTKIAAWLSECIPLDYRGSLAVVVAMLLTLVTGTTTFFFVRINQQAEAASDKIDEGISELQTQIKKYPVLRSTIATTPFISDALDIKKQPGAKPETQSENDGGEDQNDSSSTSESGLTFDSIPKPVRQAAGKIGQLFKTTFGLMVNSLLIFFVGLFLAVSPEKYRDGVVQLVPQANRDRARAVLDSTSETLWRWLIGRFGSMLATGVGAFLLLLGLGVPMAGTLGVLTGLLTFIPNIGAAVALMLAVLFSLPQGTGIVAAVVGGYMTLQLLESYVVTPLIQQKAVSLPPALLIAFQAIMGVIFGFIGAAVASPLLAAAKTIVQMVYVEDYLEAD